MSQSDSRSSSLARTVCHSDLASRSPRAAPLFFTDLGTSICHKVIRPRFQGSPFLLHLPLFFALEAAWTMALGAGPHTLEFVARSRQLNIVCTAISAQLILFLGERYSGPIGRSSSGTPIRPVSFPSAIQWKGTSGDEHLDVWPSRVDELASDLSADSSAPDVTCCAS